MNDQFHERIAEYAAGNLNSDERAEIEKHLETCVDCHGELDFWRVISKEITLQNVAIQAPKDLADQVLRQIHHRSSFKHMIMIAWGLLRSQAYLVRSEMWPASAAVMILGVIMVMIANQTSIISFLAPLVAAASLASIYGPQNDPACELTLSTPTSIWKVLLARMTLVSGYNLLLALAASLVICVFIPSEMLGTLILAWLGPLTFLSALALLLSLWIGTSNAITVSYGLWIIQFIRSPRMVEAIPALRVWDTFFSGYRQFWQSPWLLIILALVVVCVALASIQYVDRSYSQTPV